MNDFTATTIDGEQVSLQQYRGLVVLVVNTASKCGFAPQFTGLEQLYRKYHERGFTVLGFPSNQFLNQEPGTNEQILEFCSRTYDVTFPLFAKVEVNGAEAHPLWAWLKHERRGLLGGAIKWNFTKFLVGRDGQVVNRYPPNAEPETLRADIEAALAA